ncbi:class II aldolase/adducin family protein [Caldicoprobacter algeriensis]|uniref:class II aldolase/adducin family protein n=1 Tax=Caldicoprobacter algeriensis TaxID=699281 RepID=UPI002079D256|nr:class II aldolase/adducin family protein [Caldicoprobacter algeriensis]MCM8899646.1 class II aldolase/adducin family protein [Caldicoprobacter algeriensis]
MKFELLHPADQIVMIMERIYRYGMTTTSGGNISILDDNGDIWITPSGIDKGSLRRNDIIRVKPDGTIEGIHKPSIELPFHEMIYQKRPDIKAIIHAHPPALVAFSIVRKIPNTRLIPNVHLICGQVGIAEYGLPGSRDLGKKIAAQFEKGFKTVILENHGVVTGGKNLFEAFMAFETLDFCAKLELKARRLGNPRSLTDRHIEISKNKQDVTLNEFIPKRFTSEEREARRNMCQLIHRAYDQQLFTSTQGTFSQRLSDGSFIITPYGLDRKYLQEEDLVRIENGWKEAGKTPSRSVLLHKAIYDKHPHINSVLIAHPPNIMAFAVTDENFETKTIPESYIMLRNIPKLPFGCTFRQPEMTADAFSKEISVVLVENDCVIVTGSSLLNAFDKLEVAEYSAKAIIAARDLGELVTINDEQVAEIEKAFKL